jgi:hypothetical protein
MQKLLMVHSNRHIVAEFKHLIGIKQTHNKTSTESSTTDNVIDVNTRDNTINDTDSIVTDFIINPLPGNSILSSYTIYDDTENNNKNDLNNAFNNMECSAYWYQDKDINIIARALRKEIVKGKVQNFVVLPLSTSEDYHSLQQDIIEQISKLKQGESIVGVANHDKLHWTAFKAICINDKLNNVKIQVMDSGTNQDSYLNQYNLLFSDKNKYSMKNIECNKQEDASSCALFAINNSKLLADRSTVSQEDTFSQEEVKIARREYGLLYAEESLKEIVKELRNNLYVNEIDFLEEENSVRNLLNLDYIKKVTVSSVNGNNKEYQYNIIVPIEKAKSLYERLKELGSDITKILEESADIHENGRVIVERKVFRVPRTAMIGMGVRALIEKTDLQIKRRDSIHNNIERVKIKITKDKNDGASKNTRLELSDDISTKEAILAITANDLKETLGLDTHRVIELLNDRVLNISSSIAQQLDEADLNEVDANEDLLLSPLPKLHKSKSSYSEEEDLECLNTPPKPLTRFISDSSSRKNTGRESSKFQLLINKNTASNRVSLNYV